MNTDRARGALLGLAVGDALGTTLEFTKPRVAAFPTLAAGPHRDISGGGPFGVAPGQVTDDTHMACCLAASLRARGGFDAADVAARYVAWRKHTFDIGGTTASAVALLAKGALDAGRRVWEDGGRKGAANGSLMRTAPIGVFFWSDSIRRREAALGDSALTHFDPRCQLACAALNAVIALGIDDRKVGFRELKAAVKDTGIDFGEDADDLLRMVMAEKTEVDPVTHAEEEVKRAAKELARREQALAETIVAAANELLEDLWLARQDDPQLATLIHSVQGFVRVAFRLAFWELVHAPTFEAGLIDAVNRGGDADTNGAIAGALLGATHGAKAIPAAWCRRVLEALQDGPAGPLRDEYHPKVLMSMLEGMRGKAKPAPTTPRGGRGRPRAGGR